MPVTSADLQTPPSDTDRPAIAPIPGTSSMSAPCTDRTLSNAEKVLLLCRREILIFDLRQARHQHRRTSSLRAELSRLTRQSLTF